MKFFGFRISPCFIALCACFVGTASSYAQPPEILPEVEIPPLSLAEVEKIIGGRTGVSLRVENAEIADVLAAAKRETGITWRLGTRTAARGPITLNLKEQPLWALHDALRGELEYNRRNLETALGREEIPLLPAILSPLIATHDAGLMQVRITRARLTAKHWIVTLAIFVDPKLDLVSNSTRLRVLSATDELGNDLLSRDRLTSWYRQYPLIWSAQIAQVRPENMGTKVANMRGVLQASLILKREPWEIPLKNAEFPITKRFDHETYSETLSVESVTANADGTYEVQAMRIRQQLINLRFMPTTELRRMEVFNSSIFNSLKLLDEEGREFALLKSSTRAENDEATMSRSVTATFGRAPRSTGTNPVATTATPPATTTTPAPSGPQGAPARLVWNIPTDLRPIEVPFEFNDVPLTAAP